ncbi:transmembrane protein 242 [Cimex lectularius]|uniref:Transmembrane protein 242 n=1 Tax=Cimex lectularius TaxID=79782 RepID=A0A8I6RBF2_CIMLE|nr:transmembrane protein 242 [Cimex lectularius]
MDDRPQHRLDGCSTDERKDGGVDINYRFKAGTYLTSVAVLSGLAAFGVTLAAVKKKDPKMFARGMEPCPGIMEESGPELGLRALKWGTFYAFSGTSLISLAIWKLSGANSLEEFREKARQILPKLPKKENKEGKKELSSVDDVLNYLTADSQKDVKNRQKS